MSSTKATLNPLTNTKNLAIALVAIFLLIISILGLANLSNNSQSQANAQITGCAATGFIPKTSATNQNGQFYQPNDKSGPTQKEYLNSTVCVTLTGSTTALPPGTTFWNDLQGRKNYYPLSAQYNSSSSSSSVANNATCDTELSTFRKLSRGSDIPKTIAQARVLKDKNCKVSGTDARDYGLVLADIEMNQSGRLINNYMNGNPVAFLTSNGSAVKSIALANQYAKEGDFDSTFKVLDLYNSDRKARKQATKEEKILMGDLKMMWKWGYQDDTRWEYFKLWHNGIYGGVDKL